MPKGGKKNKTTFFNGNVIIIRAAAAPLSFCRLHIFFTMDLFQFLIFFIYNERAEIENFSLGKSLNKNHRRDYKGQMSVEFCTQEKRDFSPFKSSRPTTSPFPPKLNLAQLFFFSPKKEDLEGGSFSS